MSIYLLIWFRDRFRSWSGENSFETGSAHCRGAQNSKKPRMLCVCMNYIDIISEMLVADICSVGTDYRWLELSILIGLSTNRLALSIALI